MSQTPISIYSAFDSISKLLVICISGATAYLVGQINNLNIDAQEMAKQIVRIDAKDEARDELIAKLIVQVEKSISEPRVTDEELELRLKPILYRLDENDEYLDRRRLWMESTDDDLQRLADEVRTLRAQILRSRARPETERLTNE